MKLRGFTIVELLIVIVVIAIIAAISIVAYSSTTQKATVSSIQADLTNAKKQLLAFQASSTTNSFPTAINCNNPSVTEICLRPTGSNTFSYTPYTGSSPAFYLTSTNGTNTYTITESTSPLDKSSITSDGLTLQLDAANSTSYPGSGSTWYDLSQKANNATLINSPSYSSGGYFDFVASSLQVATFSDDLRKNFSLECWVNPTVVNGFAFFGNGITTPNNGLHIWMSSATTLRFGMYANDYDATLSLSAGNWYHFVFTYNNSYPYDKQIYLNGVRQNGTNVQTQSQYTGTGIVRIGAVYSSSGSYATGKFAFVTVRNKVMSPSEITQNFNALRGRYGI